MRRYALAVLLAAACHGPKKTQTPIADVPISGADSDAERRQRLEAELQDDILSSYERDDVPDVDTPLIPAAVGPARIGVGPGDVLFGDEVRQRSSSRWPLRVAPGTPTAVRSKRLDIHLSQDLSAAWASDELSWRLTLCGHVAAIPLRMTALYAHDGDRWVQVFEHLSYAQQPTPSPDGQLIGRPFDPASKEYRDATRDLSDDLSRTLSALFSRQSARIQSVVSLVHGTAGDEDVAQPAPTLLLAPDAEGEWHGTDDIERIQMVDGKLSLEERRIGYIGTSEKRATVAYWVGNIVADVAASPRAEAGKVRLRGTFVFERRKGTWLVVQGHLSQPILDSELARQVFGLALEPTNLERGEPLRVSCDDGRRATQQAAPRPGPAAGSP